MAYKYNTNISNMNHYNVPVQLQWKKPEKTWTHLSRLVITMPVLLYAYQFIRCFLKTFKNKELLKWILSISLIYFYVCGPIIYVFIDCICLICMIVKHKCVTKHQPCTIINHLQFKENSSWSRQENLEEILSW